MAVADEDHVRCTVVEDVGECFCFRAVAAGGGCVRPAAFDGVEAEAVEARLMNEAPVFETHVKAGKDPFGSVRVLVVGKCSGDFPLVVKLHQLVGGSVS